MNKVFWITTPRGGKLQFAVRIDPRTNTPYVHSIHPYDETEYHWARLANRGAAWTVYRAGKKVCTINEGMAPISYEEVARILQAMDDDLGLKPRMCHN